MRNFKKLLAILLIILTALPVFMLNSCEDNSVDNNLRDYDITDEIILGKYILNELNRDSEKWQVINDSRLTFYFNKLISAFTAHPRLNYSSDLIESATIINSDEVFIFSLPGANIIVSLGLLKTIDDESTLFALFANEICKSNERIVSKKLLKEFSVYDLIDLSTNTNTSESKIFVKKIIDNYDFIKNDLEDEYYLDSLTFYLTYSNERNVYGLKNFLEITKKNLNSDKYKKQLVLHPFSEKRIERLKAFMDKEKILPPTKQNTYYDFYQNFKKLLP